MTVNRYVEEKWAWVDGTIGMRDGLLERLTDAELAFTPGGTNMPLGELFREMGDVQHAYIQGLKTFVHHFDDRTDEAGIESSVSRLTAWFHELDDELQTVASAFTDDDLAKTVERRESGFEMPVEMSLDVYVQALLIFFGKVTIYFRAMNKPLPKSVADWIW
jgi:hypothetical protein